MSLQALQSYIMDSVVNNQPFDLVHYIESQYIQEKDAFDEDFKAKVGSLLDDSEDIVNENVLAWAKFQVESSFEVLNRTDVWRYWTNLERARLERMMRERSSS